ncbi:MAG: NAD-dependent epimerase/dehydratase family protein [Nitrosomonadales bacterium]|jgi:dihydroflavonol-4-reductase|nr:MAG: NAD-dependent epimerase/dehydratase family protein [Nitrosomonadales bacterium]
MSKICSLITGGGGFIGSHLVNQLLQKGENVKVLELPDVRLPSEVEVVRGSICDAHIVNNALKGVQRLYHLAANPNLWAADKREFQRVNFEGTRTVLQEAAKYNLEKIVYTSTESILTGSTNRNVSVDAEVHRLVKEMPGPYCRSKFLAEQEAFKAAMNGLPVVIVAPTLPIGPGDNRLTPPTRMILDFINGETPAYLNCGFNLVDVRDVAQGHILAAERGHSGERYILGHKNLYLSDLLLQIEEITGLSMPKFRIPYWIALSAGAFCEFMSDHITHQPPVVPINGVRLTRRPMFFNSDKAVHELGFLQKPIKNALVDEIEWLINMGLVTRKQLVQKSFEKKSI